MLEYTHFKISTYMLFIIKYYVYEYMYMDQSLHEKLYIIHNTIQIRDI